MDEIPKGGKAQLRHPGITSEGSVILKFEDGRGAPAL